MSLIQQETAARIWQCYREIKAAEKLLQDLEEAKNKYPEDLYAQRLKDCYGRGQGLQLGIPSGENTHRLFCVAPKLAKSIIISHIAAKKVELTEENEQARIELG